MRVWFPDFYTEAHRTPERQRDLINELEAIGVHCLSAYSPDADLVFCGSIFRAAHVRERQLIGKVPVVHYNWDLYPYLIVNVETRDKWKVYIEDLAVADLVLVPSHQTALRTLEYAQRSATVVLSPAKVWQIPQKPPQNAFPPLSYLLDVMRDYPWDKGNLYALRTCQKLKVQLIQTRTSYPWDEFRWYVANARCLLSCMDEASTGGMTLLEGYAHGVPCIVSNSPMNGAVDYFGDRATYFNHKNPETLTDLIRHSRYQQPPKDCREWVQDVHSDKVFAARLKVEFEKCLT